MEELDDGDDQEVDDLGDLGLDLVEPRQRVAVRALVPAARTHPYWSGP